MKILLVLCATKQLHYEVYSCMQYMTMYRPTATADNCKRVDSD